MRRRFTALYSLVFSFTLFSTGIAVADDDRYLQLATYTHYHGSDEHRGPPILAAMEFARAENRFLGVALFNNSFGQFSESVYYGWRFPLDGIHRGVHAKLSFGVVHGYRGEHRDDIPLNGLGVAPAVLPAVGYQRGRWGGDVILLGTAAVLFSVGYRFGD